MDAGSVKLLYRLIAMGSRSLLQYASEAVPWASETTKAALARILEIAAEEREEATRLTRLLQKKRLRQAPPASFPSHFTTGNFVSVDYLLPKLIAEHEKEVAEIESILSWTENVEVLALAQGYLDMKRRHLQTLRECLPSTTPSAAA